MANSTPYPSASLLRRLAEAADGYRDGVPRIVIARRDPPHDVAGVFDADDTRGIEEALAAAGPGFDKFGPYLTPETEQFSNRDHDVVSVTVVFRSGESREYSPAEYDALIWSIPAFDKLVMPYLTSVSGFQHAARQRAAFVSGSAIGHKLYSF